MFSSILPPFSVKCPAGTFFNVVTSVCALCPAGSYQPEEGRASCLVCPDKKSTFAQGGAKSEGDCRGELFLHYSVKTQTSEA